MILRQSRSPSFISSTAGASIHQAFRAVACDVRETRGSSANPASPRFQNCTEHTLDILMASLYDTSDQMQIKANIAAHFDPQPVRIGGVKRLLAPAASARRW